MSDRDPSHDSIVHTDGSSAGGARVPASEIVERLSGRPHLRQRYEIRGEVGRGAMGAVLRVWDADLRRQLAVKVMLALDSERGSQTASQESSAARRYARFLEEAQITGQLDHPGIVPVHEIGLDGDGRLYFTMKLVRGRELREVFELVRKGEDGWNLTRALNVLLRVCEAMAFAHEKGVVHRDLKPDNVMVGRFGEVYVMDWGLAKVLGSQDTHDVRIRRADASQSLVRTERRDRAQQADSPLATMDGDIVGTPCYMPPEQARGRLEDIGPHSDVYSVGAVLYELLGGQMPYCAPGDRPSPQAVLGALIQGPPLPLRKLTKDVPDELVAICEKAMARDIAARYPSMAGLTEDLRAYLEGRVVQAYESGAFAEFRKWIARNRAFAATLGAALLVGFASLFGMLKLAQDKNTELSQRQEELSNANAALEQEQARVKTTLAELEETAEKFRLASETATRNEKLSKLSEDLAKRKSYAASIAAADASLAINDVAAARQRLRDESHRDLREWEWVYLLHRCNTSVRSLANITTRSDAPQLVTHAASDAAGKLLAVCGQESLSRQGAGVVRLIDLEGGDVVLEFPLQGVALEALALAPDGTRLALVGSDHVVRLYRTNETTPYAQWQGPRSSTYRATIAFTRDGSELVVALSERDGVQLRSSADLGLVREVRERFGEVTTLACSPDGARLAVGVEEGMVHVIRLATLELERTIGERAAALRHVAFSPDSRRLLASTGLSRGADPRRGPWLFTVREWEVERGALLSNWQDHQGSVTWCDYAAGGRLVISVSDDRSIRVRDTLRGDAWTMLGHTGAINAGALSAGGEMFATGSVDGVVREWSPWLGEFANLTGHRRPIKSLAVLEDAERVLSIAADGSARLWDSRSALLLRVLHPSESGAERDPVWAVSPTSTQAATAGAGRVRLVSLESGAVEQTFDSGDSDPLTTLAYSPDGARLAAGSDRGLVYVWELGGTRAPAVLRGARGKASRLAWLDNGRTLAVGSTWQGASSAVRAAARGSEVNVFDVERRALLRLLGDLEGDLFALERSPEGDELLLGWRPQGKSATLRRVDVAKLEPRGADVLLDAEHATWFAEGRRIVAAGRDSGVQLVDPGSGEIELSLRAPLALTAIAVSPDGQRVIAGYEEGAIRVWSSDAPFTRHTRRASAVRARAELLEAFERAMRDEGLSAAEALAAQLARTDLDALRQQAARDLARLIESDVQRLVAEVRETCRSPRREPIDYKLALLQATHLRRAAPADGECAYAEGLALLRLGRFEAAAEAFDAATAALQKPVDSKPARQLDELQGLLALARLRKGEREAAQALFEAHRKARPVFNVVFSDPTTRDLMLEIDAAFAAPATR
jgi:serine/threonine protein kinase/WD40 repeat protein